MKTVTKSVIGVAAAVLAGAVALTPVLVTAWGDSANGRQVYTLEQINNGDLGDTITFNSITDGAIGDERNFVAAKPNGEVANENIAWKANEIDVKDGETYTIRLYVHNNSPKGTDAIATGVRANFSLPTTVGKELTVIGYITAPNATPNKYWDEVKFKSNDNFYLEYVEGSATYNNNKGTFTLPNEVVVGTGAQLGYEKMDGNIPGCYQYDGEVHIQVKVHKSVTASVEKKVRKVGDTEWGEAVDAKVGDEVEYQIEYVNLLSDTVNDVIIRDILPDNVEYVAGSTVLFNSNHQDGVAVSEETLTTTGINIGDHGAKANSYVRFTGKVIDRDLVCGQNQLVNWANSTSGGAVTAKDDASVMVVKECQPAQPEEPDEKASLEKKVRIKGTKDWSERVDAKVGDEVEYQIEYVNLLSDEVRDVMIRDILPSNVEYVAGSTVLYNSNHQDGLKMTEDTLTTTGLNIGDHAAKANSYVRFTGKVIDKNLNCGDNALVNWANSTTDGVVTAKDDASVMVAKECQKPNDQPDDEPTPDTPPVNNPDPTPSAPTQPNTPQTPQTIVDTGAGTVATGAVGAGSMVTMLGCYLASRKKLGR